MSASGGPHPVLRAVLIGLAGASLARVAGLPAAPLIGASLAVSAAAWAGMRLTMPVALRNLGFLAIGLSLGSGVDTGILDDLSHWALSLAMLALSLLATLLAGAAMLRRVAGQDRTTAILSASPGTMSYALAIAEERKADVTAVLVVQSMRLLILASVVPVAVQLLAEAPPVLPARAAMAPVPLAALAIVAAGAAAVLGRAGVPAAWLIGGFAASGVAHATGLVAGLLPGWALFAAFTVTGTVIGTRFSGLSPSALGRNLLATVMAGTVSAGVAMLFAALVAGLTAIPFAQLWVAFAPGGVEAMAAVGLALGYDPAFIAVHHLARIAILMVLVPMVLTRGR
ncbi:MAG: AbrB family transcriptional regulator [Pseudomonadota bacterium]